MSENELNFPPRQIPVIAGTIESLLDNANQYMFLRCLEHKNKELLLLKKKKVSSTKFII